MWSPERWWMTKPRSPVMGSRPEVTSSVRNVRASADSEGGEGLAGAADAVPLEESARQDQRLAGGDVFGDVLVVLVDHVAGRGENVVRHARVNSMIQLDSQVWPPSAENSCSQRADVGVMSDQMKWARIGLPSCVSSP